MMKSLQGKFLLIFMFALVLNLFRINMAQSAETDRFNLMTSSLIQKVHATVPYAID